MSQKSKTENQPIYTQSQQDIMKLLQDTYSPYVGQGVLGGLSDLETNALNMLKSADVWGPLNTTGQGLLSGSLGAEKISPEMAASTFKTAVEDPAWYTWSDKLAPTIREEYAGPGYWGSSRANAVSEGAGDVARALTSEKANWMWDAEQANRAIDEAKAGRALSALSVYPSSALGWASGIANIGGALQSKLNAITDPQVLSVLQTVLGVQPAGSVTKTTSPYGLKDYLQMGGSLANIMSGLPTIGSQQTWDQARSAMNNPYYYS